MFLLVWQGGSNCLTMWFQLSDKVVPIVRQDESNWPTEFGHSGNWNHFFWQIGPLYTKSGWPNPPIKWSKISDGSNSPTYYNWFIHPVTNSSLSSQSLRHYKCQNVRSRELQIFRECSTPHHVSHVTCYVSLSCVRCQVSGVIFLTKWCSKSVEDLFSKQPTPSSFNTL